MDELDEIDQSAGCQPEVNAFLDFVTLVVPRLGQETARWKYDVWTEEQRLTIFTLKYAKEADAVAAVDDCLCLQFSSQPSDPSSYSLIPTLSSGGQTKDLSFIETLFGGTVLSSPLEVRTLLTHLDTGQRTDDVDLQKGSSPSDTFSNFESEIVPKFGQETAVWKYDVRRAEKMLTIFRLGYNDNIATIADCLSLQLIPDPDDSSSNLFLPILSSGGKIAEATHIQSILGKETVDSADGAEDVQTILDHLDDRYMNTDEEDLGEERTTEKLPSQEVRENSEDLEDWIAAFEEDSGDEEAGGRYQDIDPEEDEPEDDPSPPLRRAVRTRDASAEVPQTTATRKKRSLEEQVQTVRPSKVAKLTKKPKKSEHEDDVDEDVFTEMHAKSKLKLDILDIPSLPAHEESGGTILSSQYWTRPATHRDKLNCAMDIYVDSVAMENLPNLLEEPSDESEEPFAQSVTYGWMLLEHLLGGRETISRSFTYATSGTSPIERTQLVKHVVDLCDAIIEHIQRTFSLESTKSVRAEVLAMLKPLTSVAYTDQKGYRDAKFRLPSDIFLRDYLEDSSYPQEGKVQVAHGFDFYVDEEKLREFEVRYKEEEIGLTATQRWCRFGMDVVTEMVGGVDVIQRGRLRNKCSTLALIGEDLLDAIYERARKTFQSQEDLPYTAFRPYVRDIYNMKTKFSVEDNTSLMASILFPSEANAASVFAGLFPDVDDPPAEPGCHYWTSPAPHRTRLSPDSDFYMLTGRLAEFQRYLGPERTKHKLIQNAGRSDHTNYIKALIPYAVGGEEEFIRRLLQRRKAKQEGKTALVLDEAVIATLFEHVELLFELPDKNKKKSAKKKLFECVEAFSAGLIKQYDKGETRWHFPELDARPKSEALSLLEAQEYWRKPAPDRTKIRPGHEVYIRTKILESIAFHYGPGSKEACIKKYIYALMVHMLGGVEMACRLRDGKTFHDGFRTMFTLDDLLAVCLHSDQVFHLMFSITPTDSLINANVLMHRNKKHINKSQARLAQGKAPERVQSALYAALSV